MSAYFRNTIIVALFITAGFVVALFTSMVWVKQQRSRFTEAVNAESYARIEKSRSEGEMKTREISIQVLRDFRTAWEPSLRVAPAKDLGNFIRNELARKATQHGLVSEGAVTPPEPKNYSIGGSITHVQQVSIKVVGESLPQIVSWLGSVENTFPIAKIDSVTLTPYGSRSVQMGISMLYPIDDASTRPLPVVGAAK